MSRKTPLDKIIENACQKISDDLQFVHDDAGETESPIEKIMLAAIAAEVRYSGLNRSHDYGHLFVRGDYEESCWLAQPSNGSLALFVECQVHIDRYRADFVVYAPTQDNGYSKLVVECDGHDYHERTKDQAARDRARDRAMQEAGYTVFRFTGSEIYRDPCKCAAQVVAWAAKATWAI